MSSGGLGPLLGCSWLLLGDRGPVLGRLWAGLGLLLAALERSWGLRRRFWIDLASFGDRFGVDLGSIWMDLGSIWVDFTYFLHLFLGSRFDAKKCAMSAQNVFLRQLFFERRS